MIIGKIKDLDTYRGISKDIDLSINYVLNTDLLALKVGKYVLNDRVTVNRQSYYGLDYEKCEAENHERFIDLQIVVKGKEGFGYAHLDNPTVTTKTDYNEEKDVTKYNVEDECVYNMEDGSFALVFREDIHRPQIKINDERIEKVVIKIKVL